MAATVADFLLQRLHEWGVERVFGYPGDGINGAFGRQHQAILSCASGPSANRHAREVQLRRGMKASLSGGLARIKQTRDRCLPPQEGR